MTNHGAAECKNKKAGIPQALFKTMEQAAQDMLETEPGVKPGWSTAPPTARKRAEKQ